MDRKPKPAHRIPEAALALGLLLSFFLPWLYSMGKPVAAPGIRRLLEGPHRLVSVFHGSSRVSADYQLSICLWAVPSVAAFLLAAIAFRSYRAWMAPLAGTAAMAAFFYLRREADAFPFVRLAWGSYAAAAAGAGLVLSPLRRLFPRKA